MKPNRKSICYWPGIRRDAKELNTLFSTLSDAGYAIDQLGAAYDTGLPPDNADSCIQKWVKDLKTITSEWWIGLSLGAAVAHIAACNSLEVHRPKRLTLINPFADRLELSRLVGFPMNGQWRLRPVDFHFGGGILVDLVISLNDECIPPEHGRRLKDCYSTGDVSLIELETNHTIADERQQRLLASMLLAR